MKLREMKNSGYNFSVCQTELNEGKYGRCVEAFIKPSIEKTKKL